MTIPFVMPWSCGGEISHDNEPSLVMDMVEQYQVANFVRGAFVQFHIASDRGGEAMIGLMRFLSGEAGAVQFDGVLMHRAS
jgi:hypothetical protein